MVSSRISSCAVPNSRCRMTQRKKIALFTNVQEAAVISAYDVDDLYKIPAMMNEQGLDDIVAKQLRLDLPAADLSEWEAIVNAKQNPEAEVNRCDGRQVRRFARLLHFVVRSPAARRYSHAHARQHPLHGSAGYRGAGRLTA